MKLGLRKPSLRGRIAARTSLKRYVRHSLGVKAPRGWGWLTNPKKAAYNRAYNRTTVDPFKLLAGGGRRRARKYSAGGGVVIGGLLLLGLLASWPWVLVLGTIFGGVALAVHLTKGQPTTPAPIFDRDQLRDLLPPASASLSDIPGIGPKMARALADAGYGSLADLQAATDQELLRVRGVGLGTIKRIRAHLST